MPANQPFWGEVVNNGATYWDLIIIADLEFVGFATVTGGVSRDIQVNKPKGADGATSTDTVSPFYKSKSILIFVQ